MSLVPILILLALAAAAAVWASDISQLPPADERSALPADGGPDYNRLIHASSPYLLQHAGNPVEWYEWGEEAFAKARDEGKPIFLSIGYSTCHWCHVMARESFEDPAVAAVLKEGFVSIKLDREERPDIDHVYMTFVQATTGHGGWPLTAFLTPERKPFYGGTYFPREQFVQLLGGITTAWDQRRDEVERSGERLVGELQRMATGGEAAAVDADAELIEDFITATERQFDDQEGGFGQAPKFPRPATLLPLQTYAASAADERGQRARHMLFATLDAMARGGMYDHVGGGFHRYSVDRYWHVPHFEKMLYDQGQLAAAYADAELIEGRGEHLVVAMDICTYAINDLRHDSGAFYSAEDADSAKPDAPDEHGEGAFYVWTAEELQDILGDRFPLFATRFGIGADGNIRSESDPHGELAGTNQLYAAAEVPAAAQAHNLDLSAAVIALNACRQSVATARAQRPRPHLDDKILTAWNGLMITGLARTAMAAGGDADAVDLYLGHAIAAADAIRELCYDAEAGQLYRVWRDGRRGATRGFADDYAFLIQGLLDCYRATLDHRHLAWARELQAQMDARFADPGGGWFTTEAAQDDVLIRAKEDYDGAEPAANSIAAGNCLRLAALLGDEDLRARGEAAIRATGILGRAAHAAPAMLHALQRQLATEASLVIVGEADAADTRALAAELHRRYRPFTTLLLLDAANREHLIAGREWLAAMTATDGAATAYLCAGRSCQAPTTDPAELGRQLDQ